MKKTLSLILAVMMLLGCMSITAFATETNTWSFNSETMTFTVNSPVPKTATVGGEIPEKVSFEGSFDGIYILGATWGKTVEQDEGYQYGSKWWNSAASTPKTKRYFEAGIQYGYVIGVNYDPQTVQKDLANAKIVWNGKEYSNIGVSVPYDVAEDLAEVFFVVDFGVLGADGNFTGGDFAETESGNKSGNADITLTVAKALTYDMVIPEDVTNLNAAGIYSVGQAKVANVKNATEKTVISYTAATTAFKCEGKTDIPASYYTDEAGQNAFPTTAVEVYKSKADVASIPTMWVKITEDAWNAAENGTYTATVTFNFTAKDTVTIADILPDDFPIVNEEQIEGLAWMDNERNKYAYIPLDDQDYIYIQPVNDEQVEIYIELDYVFNNEVYQCVKTDDNYVTTDGYKGYKYTITFNVDQNTGKFNSFEIYEEFYDLGELLTFDTVTYSAQNY